MKSDSYYSSKTENKNQYGNENQNFLYFRPDSSHSHQNYNNKIIYKTRSSSISNIQNQNGKYAPEQNLNEKILSPEDNEKKKNISNYSYTLNRGQIKKKGGTFLPEKAPKNLNKKTLILDLDETLVHSSFSPIYFQPDISLNILFNKKEHIVNVLKRPYVHEFLERMSKYFELVVFTASVAPYANPLLDRLDIRRLISHRLFREHCVSTSGLYIKDLRKLGRELKDTIILDNNPISYLVNKENGIPIPTWHFDKTDTELLKLIPILEFLSKVKDVRNYIKNFVSNNTVNFKEANLIISNEMRYKKNESLCNNININIVNHNVSNVFLNEASSNTDEKKKVMYKAKVKEKINPNSASSINKFKTCTSGLGNNQTTFQQIQIKSQIHNYQTQANNFFKINNFDNHYTPIKSKQPIQIRDEKALIRYERTPKRKITNNNNNIKRGYITADKDKSVHKNNYFLPSANKNYNSFIENYNFNYGRESVNSNINEIRKSSTPYIIKEYSINNSPTSELFYSPFSSSNRYSYPCNYHTNNYQMYQSTFISRSPKSREAYNERRKEDSNASFVPSSFTRSPTPIVRTGPYNIQERENNIRFNNRNYLYNQERENSKMEISYHQNERFFSPPYQVDKNQHKNLSQSITERFYPEKKTLLFN